MLIPRRPPAGCPIPPGAGGCLPECGAAGRCRAHVLRLLEGGTVVGRPLGVVGETLRFLSVSPSPGVLLLPFRRLEPGSLRESLQCCLGEGGPDDLVRLAEISSSRGLLEAALGDLDRAGEASPDLLPVLAGHRARFLEDAADRLLEQAREHFAAGRTARARDFLEEVLRRFPGGASAEKARVLREEPAWGGSGPPAAAPSESR